MGKLSHIADIEARQQGRAQAPAPVQQPQEPEPIQQASPQPVQQPLEPDPVEQASPQQHAPGSAQAEEEFHGISTAQPLGSGHTALIVLAVAALVAMVGYALNYWFHFI